MISNNGKAVFALLLFFTPHIVSAEILISEIMYDLPGLDAKHEWIEIVNTGKSVADLTDWRFFEDDTNHRLTVVMGSALLSPGARAVIADNTDIFLSDWPDFSGTLFDSSFSLKNTGELIAIRNAELAEVSVVVYMSSWGGKGNGDSLQFFETAWKAGPPTPGKPNIIPPALPPKTETVVRDKQVIPIVETKSEIPNQDESEELIVREQPAAVLVSAQDVMAETPKTDDLFKWLLALGGVLLLATAAVLFAQRKNVIGSEADDIEILD